MADRKLSEIDALGQGEALQDSFLFYVINPNAPAQSQDRRISLGQLKTFLGLDPQPTPQPTTTTLTFGLATSQSGNILSPQTETVTIGQEATIQQPAVTDGQYFIYELPSGFVISDIRDAHFEGRSIINQYARVGQRWVSRRLGTSSGGSYKVTIQEE